MAVWIEFGYKVLAQEISLSPVEGDQNAVKILAPESELSVLQNLMDSIESAPCAIRTHTADPVPFLLWDSEAAALPDVGRLPFTEDAAAHSALRLASGPALMELLLK